MTGKRFLVIAIDFGTAYSGYVYSVQSLTERIHCVYWGMDHGLKTLKTPTCILFNEEQQFSHFGYDAAMKYHSLPSSNAQAWFYFKHFKMELYNKQKLTSDITLTACNGKTLPALTVFSESIRFMMNHALGTIKAALSAKFNTEDVTWVLTVPAIWSSGAKQFMRLAAKEAGMIKDIHADNLVIALEAEAASIWCKKLTWEGFMAEEGEKAIFQDTPGIRYIVVDCGGGTIDMTVHEIQEDTSLKELHKVSGGNWGGTVVDRNFLEFLKEIFHSGVWEEYATLHPSEMQQMLDYFDLQKCANNKGNVLIRCYYNLIKVAEKQREIEEYFRDTDGVSWSAGHIVISHEKIKSFYADCLTNIIGALRDILIKPQIQNVKYIILVGGFSASIILREGIYEAFGRSHSILCPLESQAAIVKGALIFGNNPKTISQRICARTYGVNIAHPFLSSVHDIKKKRTSKDGKYEFCEDVFKKMVTIGDVVEVDKEVTYTFFPVEDHETKMNVDFYSTEKADARYTDETGVEKIGSLTVQMPNLELGTKRQIKLRLRFGLTEIKATATDQTSNETKTVSLDFLTDDLHSACLHTEKRS